MITIRHFTLCLALGLLHPVAYAQDTPIPPTLGKDSPTTGNAVAPGDVPPALPEEPESDSRNLPQADVHIIKRKDATIEEYRVNGQVRYIKIKPVKGPAYYMFDSDGDGVVDTREDDLANPPINRWILKEW